MGYKYLLLGLAFLVLALTLLMYNPAFLQITVNTFLGLVVIGLVFFGFVFLFVSAEEIRAGMSGGEESKEAPKAKKKK